MRGTKDPAQAVERLAQALGLRVAATETRGRRRVTTPEGKPVVDARVPRVLYRLVVLATSATDKGGRGMPIEAVREAMRLTRFVDTGAAHETTLMRSLIWRGSCLGD